jgi:hypothetical protein
VALSPYLIGSNQITSGNSLTITPGGSTTAGDAIIIAGSTSTTWLPSTVTDSQNNTYALVQAASANNPAAWTWVAFNTNPLTVSDTITVGWNNTGPAKTVFALGCSGFDSSVSVDISAANQGTSVSPSVSSGGPLLQTVELGVALIVNGNGGGAPTGFTAGWTQQGTTLHNGTNQYTSVLTNVTSSASALTVGATITSAIWSAVLITFTAPNAVGFATYNEAFCFSVSGAPGASGALTFAETFSFRVNAASSLNIVNIWNATSLDNYGMASIPISNTTGNALVVFAGWNPAEVNPVSNVSDDAHNFWTHGATSAAGGQVRCATWICPNAQAATNLSVGLSWFTQGLCIIAAEISGFPTWANIDAAVTQFSNSGGSLPLSATTTVPDIAFTCLVNAGGSASTVTPPAGWNPIGSPVVLNGPLGSTDPASTRFRAFWQTAQAGTVTASWAAPGGVAEAGCLVALKQVPAAPVQKNPNYPGVHVEAAFGYSPADPTQMPVWTDITSRTTGDSGDTAIKTQRGRQYESEAPEAGDIVVQMHNEDGALTPGNTSSPFYPGIQLGTPLRSWGTWNNRAYAIGHGYTERIPQTWPNLPQWGEVPWEAPDALDPLSNSQLPSALAGEILSDNPYGYWPGNDVYTQNAASGLPLANLSRTNQRPLIAMDGVQLRPDGNPIYSRIQTGLAWQQATIGQVAKYTANGSQGTGLPGDPSSAGIGVSQGTGATAISYNGGAF